MFDPTEFIANGRFGYICCHTGNDYHRGAPILVRWNPLRWQIGIGRDRPCWLVLNRNGRLHRRWSDLTWRLWRKRRWERQRSKKGEGGGAPWM